MSHLLEVNNLHTYFQTREGLVCAVQGVSFQLERGELLGLVGESGCGKSITALSIMRLVAPPGKIVAGEILFEGRNLLKFSNAEMRDLRGNDIAMIFQDPMTSLNPVFTGGRANCRSLTATPASFTKRCPRRPLSRRCVKLPSPIRLCALTTIRISFPAGCASES
jgi:ABC-type dipeptide/oligopeptide/nickel transport system ATPase component